MPLLLAVGKAHQVLAALTYTRQEAETRSFTNESGTL